MKKSKILALPLTLIVMFGIYAIPSFALEVLPAKMIEIPIGEFVPFAKVWEDTGYDPGTTAGYSWGKGQYDSEIFQLGRETQGFWDYRYLVGLEVGQESTTVTINNSVQIPLEIVVVENPNYRVHEKEFIVTKKDYSVFLDKMLAYIGYAEKDMEAFTYSGPEHFKVSTESIDFTKKISYLSVFKENAPYDAYFIFKLRRKKRSFEYPCRRRGRMVSILFKGCSSFVWLGRNSHCVVRDVFSPLLTNRFILSRVWLVFRLLTPTFPHSAPCPK